MKKSHPFNHYPSKLTLLAAFKLEKSKNYLFQCDLLLSGFIPGLELSPERGETSGLGDVGGGGGGRGGGPSGRIHGLSR
jgi:hypothetical protein